MSRLASIVEIAGDFRTCQPLIKTLHQEERRLVFTCPPSCDDCKTKLNGQHEKLCEAIGLDVVIYALGRTLAT